MKHVVLMCLLLYTHTSQSEIFNQNSTEGADAFLYCKHEGEVLWSKDRDGNRFNILTARPNEEIQKHNADPHKRYSVTDDLSLHIKKVSISDSGIYYCNKTPTVNLTVTASDESNTITSSYSQPGATTPSPPDFIGTAAAVSGAAVFLVLILLLWACIKRKGLSAALAKKENIYETVDDDNPTAQPVPPQNTKDIIYYLAGDPE